MKTQAAYISGIGGIFKALNGVGGKTYIKKANAKLLQAAYQKREAAYQKSSGMPLEMPFNLFIFNYLIYKIYKRHQRHTTLEHFSAVDFGIVNFINKWSNRK